MTFQDLKQRKSTIFLSESIQYYMYIYIILFSTYIYFKKTLNKFFLRDTHKEILYFLNIFKYKNI